MLSQYNADIKKTMDRISAQIQVSLLRNLWEVVEETQSCILLRLNDHELVNELIQNLTGRRSLSGSERQILSSYLQTRTSLIRDLAASRRGVRVSC